MTLFVQSPLTQPETSTPIRAGRRRVPDVIALDMATLAFAISMALSARHTHSSRRKISPSVSMMAVQIPVVLLLCHPRVLHPSPPPLLPTLTPVALQRAARIYRVATAPHQLPTNRTNPLPHHMDGRLATAASSVLLSRRDLMPRWYSSGVKHQLYCISFLGVYYLA